MTIAITAANTVNNSLTPKRRTERVVENDQYAAFTRRIVRAYARRICQGDVEALADMLDLAAELNQAITVAAQGLHEFGYSWSEIGDRAGITRQAAQQRWGGEK